jgi:hypothetical protein
MVEPTDEVLQYLAKKRIRNGEEALMLPVWKARRKTSRNISMHEIEKESSCSVKQKNSSSKKALIQSFHSKACEVLKLQPNHLRQGLLRWKEAHRTRPRKSKAA